MVRPYYEQDGVTIYHGDCREVLPSLAYSLIVSDPPWGIDLNPSTGRSSVGSKARGKKHVNHGQSYVRIHGDDTPFDPSHIIGTKCVLWGADHFRRHLPDGGCWLVWDKATRNNSPFRMAEFEMAWTNCVSNPRIFRHLWAGVFRASENISSGGQYLHPTQKPVALMKWCLELSKTSGGVVVDPYMGSGPTLLAAKSLGRRAIGIEIEERYCEIADKRLAQGVLPLLEATA